MELNQVRDLSATLPLDRQALAQRGRRLEYFTIARNRFNWPLRYRLGCRSTLRRGDVISQRTASALSRQWPGGRCCVAAESFQSLATARLRVARCENQSELCRSGFTATDLNQHRGYQTVEQGASEAVRLALLPAERPTGGFFSTAGRDPW